MTTQLSVESFVGFPRERVLAELERNLQELWKCFGRVPGGALFEEEDALWFDAPIRTLPYHGVLRFHAGEHADRRIDELCAHFEGQGVPAMWVVHPSAGPGDLGERLVARGFSEIERLTGMVARLPDLAPAPEPPPGVSIREVVDETELREALDLIAWRWEVPGDQRDALDAFNEHFRIGSPEARIRVWLARRDGQPISKAVLHCTDASAGIHGVVTRPEARGLGLARALTLHAFAAARAAGHEMAVLHSSPMARTLYRGMGFVEVAPFLIYATGDLHI